MFGGTLTLVISIQNLNMEYQFSYRDHKGKDQGSSSRLWVKSLVPLDGETRNSILEEMFNNIAELMNFDTYDRWCSCPAAMEQITAF